MRVVCVLLLLMLSGCASDPPDAPMAPVRVEPASGGAPTADAGAGGSPSTTAPMQDGTTDAASAAPSDNGTQPDDPAEPRGNATPEGDATPEGNATPSGGTPQDNGTAPGDNSTAPGNGTAPAVEQRLLEISVFDYTYWAWDAPKDVQVDVVDFGTWVPDMQYDSAGPYPMGRHDVGVLHEGGLTVYTDGRNGPVCTIHFEVTAEMVDESFDAVTHVEIYADTVHIYGMAIPNYPDWEHPYICGR